LREWPVLVFRRGRVMAQPGADAPRSRLFEQQFDAGPL
jgi:hypothetical protein